MGTPPLFDIIRIAHIANVEIEFACRETHNGRDLIALCCSDGMILFRSLEEDGIPRWWRIPWFASKEKRILDMTMNPAGDWIACITHCGTFHMIPLLSLILKRRNCLLMEQAESYRKYFPDESMSVRPTKIGVKLTSYLRSMNEAGGINGARYRSSVAGDDEDMSILEFAAGFGKPTRCVWWHCSNGMEYLLASSTEGLISFINVQENREECRCQLTGSPEIVFIDIIQETYSQEIRKNILVKTANNEYYKVLIEKQLEVEDSLCIRTFPRDFLNDDDFKPRRIKKFGADYELFAVRGEDGENTGIAAFNRQKCLLSIYSNFLWTLNGECFLPEFVDSIISCTLYLIIAQTIDNKIIWLSRPSKRITNSSLPSHQAHVVQECYLHQKEKIEGLFFYVPRKSSSLIQPRNQCMQSFILFTKHFVYQATSVWDKSFFIEQVIHQTISLERAFSLGCAIGVNLPETFLHVANLLSEQCDKIEVNSNWILQMYNMSNAAPSFVVERLLYHGLVSIALDYAYSILMNKSRRDLEYNREERQGLAHTLLKCSMQKIMSDHSASQLMKSSISTSSTGTSKLVTTSSDFQSIVLSPLSRNSKVSFPISKVSWTGKDLQEFLITNQDFSTSFVVDLLLDYGRTEEALLVANCRNCVNDVLLKLLEKGMTLVPVTTIQYLIHQGYARNLGSIYCRSLLRSLDINLQVEILLDDPPSLLQHRDWILVTLPRISVKHCHAIAELLDPRTVNVRDNVMSKSNPTSFMSFQSDKTTSEEMPVNPEEKLELFLTILLRLNDGETSFSSPYGQQDLEILLKKLSCCYRSSVMVYRCCDFENWKALAVIYESNEEHVLALEYRLRVHHLDLHMDPQRVKKDLTSLLQSLVEQCSLEQDRTLQNCIDNQAMLVLARLIVEWHKRQVSITELEDFLLQDSVFPTIASLLSSIFFCDISVNNSSNRHGYNEDHTGLDKSYISECKLIKFSGKFFLHITKYELEVVLLSGLKLHCIPTERLFHMVLNNLEHHEMEIAQLHLAPSTPSQLGICDPLETHLIAFTCGHKYPKRLFYESIIPTLEKKLNSFVKLLYNTKRLLASEYRRSIIENACPVCAYNQLYEDDKAREHQTSRKQHSLHWNR